MSKKKIESLVEKFNRGEYEKVISEIELSGIKDSFDVANLESASWSLLGDYEKAKSAYLRAIKLNPKDFGIRFNFAKLEKLHGDIVVAEEMMQRLNSEFPLNAQVLIELGVMSSLRRDYSLAEDYFKKSLAIQPDSILAARNLSTLLTHRGDFKSALEIFESGLFVDNISATLQRATIFQISARYFEAEKLFLYLSDCNCIDVMSDEEKSSFYTNYGGLLVELGRAAEAEEFYKKAVDVNENNVMTHINWALFYFNVLNDFEKSELHFLKALELEPLGVEVNKWYGDYLRAKGDAGKAIELLRIALQERPDEPELIYHLAMAELCNGELEQGWRHNEMRWIRPELGGKPEYPWQEWMGEDGSGRSILVYREQGLGDELIFATCLPELAEKFTNVVYACHPKIVALLSRTYPEIIVIPNRVPRHELALEHFDYKVALGSLPCWLRPSLDSFPVMNRLLLCDPVRAEHWADRLAAYGNTLKVGIAWRSGYVTASRSRSYLSIQELEPLFRLENVTFVNLQYQITNDERVFFDSQLGANWVYPREIDLYDDLDASASLVKACDLVISVNASTAIISSAQGVPTLMLNAMPMEWAQLGTAGYPWFPAITIISKPIEQGWEEVVQRAAFITGCLATEKND